MLLSQRATSVAPVRNDLALVPRISSLSPGPTELKRIVIHRICLFGFDENKGNSLLASSRVSKRYSVASHTDAELAEICLPDGGHLREHDAVSLMLRTSTDAFLYGYACFRNVKNEGEKRGARQASLLLISDSQNMDTFRPILMDALDVLINGDNWGDYEYWCRSLTLLKVSIERGFNNPAPQASRLITFEDGQLEDMVLLDMWQRTYKIRRQPMALGEFGGGFVKDLLKVFKEKTIRIWYAIAAEKRVVFVGGAHTNAASVSNLVLATPMLVGDLAEFVVPTLEPYITLAVVDRILGRRVFVCGTNNALFLQKSDWWDVCCDVSTGQVIEEYHQLIPVNVTAEASENSGCHQQVTKGKLKSLRRRLSSINRGFPITTSPTQHLQSPAIVQPKVCGGAEMNFISRVLHDSEFQSEAWVRRQFHDFTLSFLNRVSRRENHTDLTMALAGLFPASSIMQTKMGKFAEQFPQTKLWKKYRGKQDQIWGGSRLPNPRSPLSSDNLNFDVPSPTSNSAIPFEDDSSFLSLKGKSLAPFMLETACGIMRPPTGFIKVEEGPKRQASPSFFSNNKNSPMQSHAARQCAEKSTTAGRWIKVASEEGEPYYWNVITGETTWDTPDEELL